MAREPDQLHGKGTGGTELSTEEARLTLEHLRELVDEREPGAAADDEDLQDHTERILSSLSALPIPNALKREPVERAATWTRVLMTEGGHGRQGGPEQIRLLIHDQIAVLRDLLSRTFDEE